MNVVEEIRAMSHAELTAAFVQLRHDEAARRARAVAAAARLRAKA